MARHGLRLNARVFEIVCGAGCWRKALHLKSSLLGGIADRLQRRCLSGAGHALQSHDLVMAIEYRPHDRLLGVAEVRVGCKRRFWMLSGASASCLSQALLHVLQNVGLITLHLRRGEDTPGASGPLRQPR